jgi:hypothetical protein
MNLLLNNDFITNLLFWFDVQNLPQVVVLRQRAQPVLHDGVADNVLQGEVIVDVRGLKYGKGSITLNVLRVEVKFILDDRGLKYGKGCVTLNVLQDKYLKLSLF